MNNIFSVCSELYMTARHYSANVFTLFTDDFKIFVSDARPIVLVTCWF